MEAMREAWTDERLDDLSDRMDRDFARVDARFDRFEAEVERRFDKLDDRFDKLEDSLGSRFERIDSRFEWLWRLMLASYVTAFLAVLAVSS